MPVSSLLLNRELPARVSPGDLSAHLCCEDLDKELAGLKRRKLYEDLYEKTNLDFRGSSERPDFQDVINPLI